MIKKLRKRHLQVWMTLAILLPAGIFIAWMSIPQRLKDTLLQPAPVKALPNVLASKENDNYTVRIRSNNDTSQLQLEWINKKTLTFPTATIYQLPINDTNIIHGKLVGRIEARGNYYFNVDASFKKQEQSLYHLVLYDFIHQQIIDTITFNGQ